MPRGVFGSLLAVNGVSLEVEAGDLRAVIGPNGAGKTTFFNLISGSSRPAPAASGFATATSPTCRRISGSELGMARTFQITEIFPELTVRENLRVPVEVAAGLRLAPWLSRRRNAEIDERIAALLEQGGLAGKADRLVGELSHGDQRATEIMMALALNPSLLLLDEPTAGMGDQETHDIVQLIGKAAQGATAGHRADRARHAGGIPSGDAHHGAGRGRCAGGGPPAEIAANERVQAAYLGADRMSVLAADGPHTFYGKSHILHGVGLTVGEGEIVTLLGRNGAGKSTTLRSLIGLTPARRAACASSVRPPPPGRPIASSAWGSASCRRAGASSAA